MGSAARYDELIWLPRAVRFPVELVPPPGFDPQRLATWPDVVGRLEHHEGKLLYMPPCGDVQQDTVADVVITLGAWVRRQPGFVLATNEAGMRLGGATRAADVAVWLRSDAAVRTGGLRRVAPVLAVEISGQEEDESALREKVRWYLSVGVAVVWLLFPEQRRVLAVTPEATMDYALGEVLAETPPLPNLSPSVGELFHQLLHP